MRRKLMYEQQRQEALERQAMAAQQAVAAQEREGGKGMTCKEHEWVVFSTALEQGWLILQCVTCGLHATVDDPSKEEWAQAFHAPSKPYRWQDDTRVVVHEEHPAEQRYVQKKPPTAKKCECYAKLGVSEPGGYENPALDFLTVAVEEVPAAESDEVQKAWRFHVDVVGYGEDPEEAWGNLLLYSLREPPPCERVPDQDVRLDDEEQPGLPGPGKEEQ